MISDASRAWFLTWTTYATWLPGDDRGFVGAVRETDSRLKVKRDGFGVPYEPPAPGLRSAARSRLRGEPIRFRAEQAATVADQIEETAAYRDWAVHAVAVMANHVHVVLTVPGDPDPEILLRDLKAYASRTLNARFGKPRNGTWWTRSGSKRRCHGQSALLTRVRYVRDQPGALVVRLHPEYRLP